MEAMNRSSQLDWATAGRPISGEIESGDHFLVAEIPVGYVLAVVDGLGHGAEAAEAARVTVEVLRENARPALPDLVKQCHTALVHTRGVALTLAVINLEGAYLEWLSVGNVEGLLLRSSNGADIQRKAILMRGGVVGYHLPDLKVERLPLIDRDLLVLATDGVESGFSREIRVHSAVQSIADDIIARFARASDDALVLSARFQGN
jgi:serine phosphatase RsbU (regulator of sigma subunit)